MLSWVFALPKRNSGAQPGRLKTDAFFLSYTPTREVVVIYSLLNAQESEALSIAAPSNSHHFIFPASRPVHLYSSLLPVIPAYIFAFIVHRAIYPTHLPIISSISSCQFSSAGSYSVL
jgi:hypothetical protein